MNVPRVVTTYSNPDGYEGPNTWNAPPVPGGTIVRLEKKKKAAKADKPPSTPADKVMGTAWCFTSFDEEETGRIRSLVDAVALVVGREVCPTTGRVHFQGYIRFKANKRVSWWHNQFPGLHVEKRRLSEPEAAGYCRKDGDVIVDFGCEAPVRKTADSTDEVLNMIEDGAPMWQVYKAHRRFFFHNNRKIKDLVADMAVWKLEGADFTSK